MSDCMGALPTGSIQDDDRVVSPKKAQRMDGGAYPVPLALRQRLRLDPRLFQIATLCGLLVVAMLVYQTGASLAQLCCTFGGAVLTQACAARISRTMFDWRSPAVTALSLTLLLRSHDPAIWALSGTLGVGSKFAVRWGGKHLFNPACCAIVTLLMCGAPVWVSPGQWGALAWGAAALICAATLVLSRARRLDTACAFLTGWGALLAARCVSLGDPWTIPLHQMQSGALLVFAFFMVTDPRSTPDARAGRIVFALAVAAVGHLLQFRWQVREGLFFALVCAAPLTPLLDRLAPARRFAWFSIPEEA